MNSTKCALLRTSCEAKMRARPPAWVLHKTCKNLAKGGTRASSTPRHLPIERKQVIAEEILGADKETSYTDRVASITQILQLVKYVIVFEGLWKSLKVSESLWKVSERLWTSLKSLKISEISINLWKFLNVSECLWMSLKSLKVSAKSLKISEKSLLSLIE